MFIKSSESVVKSPLCKARKTVFFRGKIPVVFAVVAEEHLFFQFQGEG